MTRRRDDDTEPRSRVLLPSEDWAATMVGLLLLVLALTGVIPTGLVP